MNCMVIQQIMSSEECYFSVLFACEMLEVLSKHFYIALEEDFTCWRV